MKSNVFLKFKSKNWLFSALCMVGSLAFCVLMFIAYTTINGYASEKNSKPISRVIIDAGHGGEDGGAVGVDGIVEKDINLAIALKLKDLLEVSGYEVIMTREKDQAIYDDSAKSLREKKRSDLKNRMGIINKNKENHTVFVSVHQNKFPNPKYFGTQIFYSVNNPKSQELANKLKESVVGLIQPENDREIKPSNEKIYLLHNAQIPAVIVECGFLSNEQEAKKLTNEKYQGDIAFSIYCGIIDYFLNT